MKIERGSIWRFNDPSRPEFWGGWVEVYAFDKDTVTVGIEGGNRVAPMKRGPQNYPRWKVWRPLFEANAEVVKDTRGKFVANRHTRHFRVKRFGFVKPQSPAATWKQRLKHLPRHKAA